MGIGRFRISDPGEFDEPDLNRQWAATRNTLGRNKADVYAEFVRSVNPDAEVDILPGGVTEDNVEAFLEGADLLVDALDLKVAPPVRLICKEVGVSVREIYKLFTSGPARGACRVAGLPKPDGCV